MLDKKGFDLWADGYDKAVGLSYEDKTYPFAGYKEVLARIYQMVMSCKHDKVLDIGFGTATLTQKLYDQGCEVWGQDFSERMIEIAAAKMPSAHLFCGDFSQGLAEPLLNNSYDFIVATYSLHHLSDEKKIAFLRVLQGLLKEGGAIVIGDVAFANMRDWEQCRTAAGEEWDDEEFYFVYDKLQKEFPAMKFEKISFCAGVMYLPRK